MPTCEPSEELLNRTREQFATIHQQNKFEVPQIVLAHVTAFWEMILKMTTTEEDYRLGVTLFLTIMKSIAEITWENKEITPPPRRTDQPAK